jgi:5-methylcytosine-specific restriction endonuclease McrA
MKLLRQRIADRKLTDTIYRFLKAGYQEDGVIRKPSVGIPQGSVASPLLANAYLHELDKWWSEKYDHSKSTRRRKHLGNFILVRYCDDFIILSNGTRQATEAMKAEVTMFLKDELRLELSQEKTAITHATEGFDFLGFHIRKFGKHGGVMITPTKANVQKIKDRISRTLSRKNHEVAVVDVIRALNPVIRGWANYYRFVNSARTFHALDFYLGAKFMKWYRGKHRKPARKGSVEAHKWMDRKKPFHLSRFYDVKVKRYRWRRYSNPYIEMDVKRMTSTPFPETNWYGKSGRNADLRLLCFQRDQGVCQICMRPKTNLVAHDTTPISKGGENALDNLVTLCEDCHREHHKELHYECRSWQEIKRLGGSRVRGNRACAVST